MDFDIKKIAKLAKLQLTTEEEHRFGKELEGLISYFQVLEEIEDDPNMPVTSLLTGKEREDRVEETSLHIIQSELLAASPHKDDTLIRLPPVFDI